MMRGFRVVSSPTVYTGWLAILLVFGALTHSTAIAQDPDAPSVQLRSSSYLGQLKPKRVAVVTTFNRLDRLPEQDVFSQAVADALGTCLGMQATIAKTRQCLDEMPHHSGVFDEFLLVDMYRQLRAEAVVYCEVVHFDAYAPYTLQAHILMVDTREAVALLECDVSLNLGCAEVRRYFQQYLDASESQSPSVSTPTMFLDYCARVAVSSVAKQF